MKLHGKNIDKSIVLCLAFVALLGDCTQFHFVQYFKQQKVVMQPQQRTTEITENELASELISISNYKTTLFLRIVNSIQTYSQR